MDSAGNEVIIVDDRAQTNGFNGNYSEEAIAAAAAAAAASSEMKTRSKASGGPGEAAKLRSRAAAANVSNSHGSKTEDNTAVIAGSNVSTSAAANEKDKKMSLRSGVADQPESASKAAEGKKSGGGEGTPGPKSSKKGSGSVGDREDDSGINSRASSVSTDDTYSSRLRTRSKRVEALSTSTPASTRKTSSRMPLSTYDFDDDIVLQIDEDPSSSGSSLKRKATKVLIEEMEEEPEAGSDEDEPPVKVHIRPVSARWYLPLLQPFTSLRSKFSFKSQSEEQNEKPVADTDETIPSKVKENEPAKTEPTSEAAAITDTNEEGKEAPSTCMVM